MPLSEGGVNAFRFWFFLALVVLVCRFASKIAFSTDYQFSADIAIAK